MTSSFSQCSHFCHPHGNAKTAFSDFSTLGPWKCCFRVDRRPRRQRFFWLLTQGHYNSIIIIIILQHNRFLIKSITERWLMRPTRGQRAPCHLQRPHESPALRLLTLILTEWERICKLIICLILKPTEVYVTVRTESKCLQRRSDHYLLLLFRNVFRRKMNPGPLTNQRDIGMCLTSHNKQSDMLYNCCSEWNQILDIHSFIHLFKVSLDPT